MFKVQGLGQTRPIKCLTVRRPIIISRAAMGVKNLWAMKVSGPQKAMHFWKVHYLPPGALYIQGLVQYSV